MAATLRIASDETARAMPRRFKFTAAALRTVKPPTKGAAWVYDAEQPRLAYMLTDSGKKSFYLVAKIDGQCVRRRLGAITDYSIQGARDAANDRYIAEKNGEAIAPARPVATEWQKYTLADAVEDHAKRMQRKGKADRSIADMRRTIERYASDWNARPVCELRRIDCITRHALVSEKNGPVAANALMRHVRAAYNSACKTWEDMPQSNPVKGVEFNQETRRQEPIPWEQLPAWWAKVRGLDNAIRRDLQLTILFTGLRSTDARTIRWNEIDFKAGTVHRPNPKGGAAKAFTVPLSRFILRLLARRRVQNVAEFGASCPWMFPTRDREGQIVPVQEAKEQRFETLDNGKKRKTFYLPTPHRLRDTFATAAHEAGVTKMDTKILMNHTLPDADVTEGYMRPGDTHLRDSITRVEKLLLSRKRKPLAAKVQKTRKTK